MRSRSTKYKVIKEMSLSVDDERATEPMRSDEDERCLDIETYQDMPQG